MAAGEYDITCEQGATLSLTFTWKDSSDAAVNLTGYSARMQVREKATSPGTLLSLTNGSGLTLGGSAGTIALSVSATATAALEAGQYVYDLELQSGGGVVTRLLEGRFTVKAEVTR